MRLVLLLYLLQESSRLVPNFGEHFVDVSFTHSAPNVEARKRFKLGVHSLLHLNRLVDFASFNAPVYIQPGTRGSKIFYSVGPARRFEVRRTTHQSRSLACFG